MREPSCTFSLLGVPQPVKAAMSIILNGEIGHGSYSKVYKATVTTQDSVSYMALKYVEYNKVSGLTSILEPYILLHINVPTLVHAHKVTIDINGNFQILQRLALGDAAAIIRKRSVIPTAPMLKRWTYQLVLSLAHLHSKGILHQDIKAANVMLYGDSIENADVKLGDFSISTLIMDARQGTYDVGTSLAYTTTHRPPEVWEHKRYGYTADIWALGCTLYELAYQQLLFIDQKGFVDQKAAHLKAIESWQRHGQVRFTPLIIMDHKPPVLTQRWYSVQMKEFNDLLVRMLTVDPIQRATIWDVIKHPYFDEVRNESDLPRLSYPLVTYPYIDVSQDLIDAAQVISNDPSVLELGLSLYTRSEKTPLKTCLHIAHKILYKIPPPNATKVTWKDVEDEIQLCILLGHQLLVH